MAEFTDEQIEAFVQKHGAKWDGNHWTIEDADLHPLIRAALSAPQEAGKAEGERDAN